MDIVLSTDVACADSSGAFADVTGGAGILKIKESYADVDIDFRIPVTIASDTETFDVDLLCTLMNSDGTASSTSLRISGGNPGDGGTAKTAGLFGTEASTAADLKFLSASKTLEGLPGGTYRFKLQYRAESGGATIEGASHDAVVSIKPRKPKQLNAYGERGVHQGLV